MQGTPGIGIKRAPHVLTACWLGAALGLAGCSSDNELAMPKLSQLNPFAQSETPLPGKRIAVLTEENSLASQLETGSLPVSLPPPIANVDWPAPGGSANNAPGHLAFGGSLRTVWSTIAGTGSSSASKVTARPVILDGKLFVLDASGSVAALSAASGAKSWTVSLAPEGEENVKGYGGGLAADAGMLFGASGFGSAVALDASSGQKRWEKQLGAPVRVAPAVANGRMVVVTTEGRVVCLSTSDGSEIWSYRGTPQQSAALLNASSPAILGSIVVVPFAAGEIVALDVSTGQALWSEVLSQGRGASALASLSDPASPVIDGSAVYATSNGGRLIATDAGTGERLWSQAVSSAKTPWVAGDTIYVADTRGQLVATSKSNGGVLWATKLPGDGRIWTAPVLAGGRLWLASNKGKLVGVDATSGSVTADRDMGTPVFVPPIVAGGRLYVLDDDARVTAFD